MDPVRVYKVWGLGFVALTDGLGSLLLLNCFKALRIQDIGKVATVSNHTVYLVSCCLDGLRVRNQKMEPPDTPLVFQI